MRIEWYMDSNAPTCRVVNRNTGKQIMYCRMADEETGQYEQWEHDGKGFVIRNGRVGVVSGVANLEIQLLSFYDPYELDAMRN